MNYYVEKEISLQDVERLAIEQQYEAHWVPKSYFGSSRLSIVFGAESGQWWQWYEVSLDDLWFDQEARRNQLTKLSPSSIILFEYHQAYLNEIVVFLDVVMGQFGGWLDCKGDLQTMYTRKTLKNIMSGCP